MESLYSVHPRYQNQAHAGFSSSCGVCSTDTLQYAFCKDCETILCEACFKYHQRFTTTRRHRIKKLYFGEQQLCNEHKGKNLDVFCYNHIELICEDCVNGCHYECHVKSVHGATRLEEYEVQLLKKQMNAFQTNIWEAKEHRLKDIKDQKALVVKQINEFSQNAIEQIKKYRYRSKKEVNEAFIEEVSRMESLTLQTIDELKKHERSLIQFQHTVTVLSDLVTKIKDTISRSYQPVRPIRIPDTWYKMDKIVSDICYQKHWSTDYASFQKDELTDSISFRKHVPEDNSTSGRQKSESADSMGFQKKESIIMKTEECRGNLDCSPSDMYDLESDGGGYSSMTDTIHPSEANIVPKNYDQISTKKAGVLDIKTVEDGSDCCITGLCVTGNGCILMADNYNKKVKLFSANGKYLSFVQTSGEPLDITVTGEDEAAVSMWMNMKTILLIGLKNDQLTIKSSIKLRNRIYGISAVGDDLAISCDDLIPSVQLINRDAHVKWSCAFSPEGRKMFKAPGYIITHTTDNTPHILVSDREYHTVTIIEAASGILKRVCSLSKTGPHGITTDNFGNVYVGHCFKAGIYVWSNNMSDHKVLLSGNDGIQRPNAIVYNPISCELLLSSWRCNTIERFKIL